jgi:hypothetical protein
LLVAIAPLTIVRQLTIARNAGIGFVPCRSSGTGAPSSSTGPSTLTSPLALSSPRPRSICQGSPPPGTSRTGFIVPTNGPSTPNIVSNSKMFFPSEPALDT